MSGKSSDAELENGHAEQRQHDQDGETKRSSEKAAASAESERHVLPFRQWIEARMSWSWFTCTQSTGGIATLLSLCPKRFDGLDTIGLIVFFLNLVLFPLFTALMAIRWASNPAIIKRCFTTPPECFFFGAYWLSAATMIVNAQRYGVPHTGPWLITAIRVCFWLYAAVTLCVSVLHFIVIARATPIKALDFSPAMIILILSMMLTGTVAATIAEGQPPDQRVPIMVAGVAYQGLGWIICMVFITLTLATLLEKGWPSTALRPGLFILTGTQGFTIVALVGCARAAPTNYGFFATHPIAAEVVLIVAVWAGVFIWLFCLWSFGIAFFITISDVWTRKEGKWTFNMQFTNTAWAIIFPNVGWALATVYLGRELESEGILWVSTVMIILLVAFWLLDLFLMAKTIYKSLYTDSRIKLS